MSSYRIRLTRTQFDDLAKLCALGLPTIRSITTALNSDGAVIQPKKIEQIIAAQANVDSATAKSVQRVLLGLATASRRTSTDTSPLLDSVVDPYPESWDSDQRQRWTECRSAIEELLLSKAITLAAKGIDLSLDFERLFLSCRIITDARPIFNVERNEIVGASITQTLRIEYMGADGEEGNISMAVDSKDIQQLASESEKAIRKAEITRALMDQVKVPTLTIGDESNG